MSAADFFKLATLQNAVGATANGDPLRVAGFNIVMFVLTGTFDATVTFEATIDGTNWFSIQTTNLATGNSATTTTSTGLFQASISGVVDVRARVSTYASGNVTVKAVATVGAATGHTNESTIAVYSSESFQATITSANATSATAVKAKTAAKKIYVTDMVISTDTAMNIQVQDDTGTPVVLIEQMYFPANSIWSKQFKTPMVVDTNKDLDIIASASGNISVYVSGFVI